MDEQVIETRDTPGWITAGIGIVAIIALAGLGFGWSSYNNMSAVQQAASAQIKTAQQDSAQQIAALDMRLTQEEATDTTLQSDLGVVTKSLRITTAQLKQARTEAAQIRTDSEQKFSDLDTNVADVKTQLTTKASSDDLNNVNGSVTVVKNDLDGTKNDLKMARSELGTLIARNHDEVDVLRRMGERNYIEFTVAGRSRPQKVGGITVELRSVDTKRNKFTVALVVDDLRTEKKDRTVNEPIVFYPNGSHQPNEIVVNSVSKDKISGYVSTPKNPNLSATAASGF